MEDFFAWAVLCLRQLHQCRSSPVRVFSGRNWVIVSTCSFSPDTAVHPPSELSPLSGAPRAIVNDGDSECRKSAPWRATVSCGWRRRIVARVWFFFIVNGFALWSFLRIARLVFITLPSDGAIVSIVHKYVEAGTVPEKWDLRVVRCIAARLGGVSRLRWINGCICVSAQVKLTRISSVMLLRILLSHHSALRHSPGEIQSS